jgi:FimV-like protein
MTARRVIATLTLACAMHVAHGEDAPRTYGPVNARETLHSIAMQVRPERSARSTCQATVALYWANPDAFRSSIHTLQPGAVLRVPDAKTIASVPGDIADRLYSDPSFDFAAVPASSRSIAAVEPDTVAVPLPVIPLPRPPLPMPPPESDSDVAEVAAAAPSPVAAPPVEATPAIPPPAAVLPRVRPPIAIIEEPAAASADSTDAADLGLRRRPGEAAVTPERARTASGPLTVNPNANSGLVAVAPPQRPWMPETWTKAPVPDRWRLLNALELMPQRWYDPYHQNTWKGDKPIRNGDEFLILSAIFDAIVEPRRFPQPVGPQSTTGAGSTGIFGGSDNTLFNTNLILSVVYLKGDTTFRPPDWEYHFLPVISFNYARNEESRVLEIDPDNGTARTDSHIGIQELFADYHLRNVSDRFDFDSIRVGIQPFSSDFRGFLFQDNQLMVRYFGTRDNNRWQFNLALMRRLEKDTNTALNAVEKDPRHDDTLFANLYRQDWPMLGFTSQVTLAHNRNREDKRGLFFNDNGFVERPASIGTESPRKYDVTYIGYNGDGHFGRLNVTASTYLAIGEESSGVFVDAKRDIAAAFAAAEFSIDTDWIRHRVSLLWGSGDDDPYDNEANGFDAIFENPTFAGADTSFWFRQAVPLIGGGIVNLSQRNALLNNLRSSKEHGQSNFANPGILLAGFGQDFDIAPQVRVSTNFNHLWFDDTAVLEVARHQGGIDRDIGWDLSAALIWRPFFTQNVILRLSGAYLLPGQGFEDLYPDEEGYSVLGNLILAY